METKPVLEVLNGKANYLKWSVRVKTYLMAQDLWDIVEATNEPPTPENKAFKAWSKMNAMALYGIQNSCGPDTFSDIMEITSARKAWEKLAEKYKPRGPEPSSSMASVPFAEDNLDANSRSGTIQISSDIREITSDSSTNPGESDQRGNIDVGVEIRALYRAIQGGDWQAAKEFLNSHPDAIRAKIAVGNKTALHVAAEAGHVDIVKELVELMDEDDLGIQDIEGFTALARATYNGNYRMVECMLGKNENLVRIPTCGRQIPVGLALHNVDLELARYLYFRTPLEIRKPENDFTGSLVVCEAIYSKALDIALDLVQHWPHLAVTPQRAGDSPFYALASMPDYFLSGNRLVFWKRWIYSGIHIHSGGHVNDIRLNIQKSMGNKSRSNSKDIIGSGIYSLSQLVSKLRTILGIEHLYEMKLAYSQSRELLKLMTDQMLIANAEQRATCKVGVAVVRAVKEGIFEFVFDIVKANPQLVWSCDPISSNIFSVAVQYRHAKIFSLIYGLHIKVSLASTPDFSKGNNLLHMAGMSAPSTSLDHIAGAALQMQRELQWFKEVESIAPTLIHGARNKAGLTPRQLFTKDHADMMSKGEKWMKDTASSCTVVAALIVTIMFSAVFTVPGGNDQNNGFPIFLNKKLFMVFIVSDALSLFSSSTSLLMFLGILTSRYAEEDFLESLPRKMIIGLSTLFFSIVTMMTTFSAALLLMLYDESWIFKPIIFLASIPITLFVLMQFPLLVAMVISTYGPSIFDRKLKPWF